MKNVIDRKLLVFLAVFTLAGIYALFNQTDQVGPENAPSGLVPSDALSTLDDATQERIVAGYGNLPLSFEENLGQTDAQVHFLSRGSGYSLFLTGTEAVLSLHRAAGAEDEAAISDVVRVQLVGSNPSPAMSGQELLPGKSNYLIGNDPAKWRTGISNYEKVAYQDVYPGVDLVYYGTVQRQLEHDFVVAPGADADQIRFSVQGAESLRLDERGNLLASTGGGDVVFQAPVSYQDIDGERRSVASRYMLLSSAGDLAGTGGDEVGGESSIVSFELASYDLGHALVIDPVVSYATYLGANEEPFGFDSNEARGIAVDDLGNAYITGWTGSALFPITVGGAYPGGGLAAFVTKLNSAGSALVYSTYLGGSGLDQPHGIAVDGLGQAYVGGVTSSSNFPLLNPVQGAHAGGGFDAFVTKLNSAGSALVYSTYLGGSGNDNGKGIAVDGLGQAYVGGKTSSPNFPTLNAFQPSLAGTEDVFVSKLNAAGALVYSTYLGGTVVEQGGNIAVDGSGNAYVTGITTSSNFPLVSAFQGAYGGAVDAFVSKFNAAGALVYSTYLGGTSGEQGGDIAVDGSGNAYITGTTSSLNFPTLNAFQGAHAGGINDVFVTKLNSAGSALVFSTYLGGGTNQDIGQGIEVDASGNVFVLGHTFSTDFPLVAETQTLHGGNFDFTLSMLNSAGSALVFSTYLGGPARDDAWGLAVDGSGNAYVAGTTRGGGFPTVAAFDASFSGERDGVVAKFAGFVAPPPPPVEVSLPTLTATYNQALTIPVSISEASGIIAADVTVEYDTALLTLVTPAPAGVTSTGTLTDGWSVEYNTEAGAGTLEKVKIALATDVNAITGPATLININFTVNDVRLPYFSLLTLSDVLLNDGTPANVTTDGLVTLVGNDGTMDSSPVQFIPRENLTLTVVDADADVTSGPGNDNVSVSVTNLNNGDVINATLPEDAATAGTFSLVVPTEFGLAAIADATIQAQAADVIESIFVDALDSNGNGPTNRIDQSTAIGGFDGTAAITQVTQPGDVIYLRVDDTDLNTDDQTAETAQIVVTSSNGESETITLNEVDIDDDVFFGSLNSASGAVAGTNDDGTINTAKGDVLTATYDDVVTALGDQLDRVDTNQGVVDPFGDADGNGLIQAFDAAQVLQHILVPPLVTLTGLELLAADVADNFGEITPFDASFILQKVVGLITTFPVQQAASLNHPQSVPSSPTPKKAVERRGLILAYTDGYLSVQVDERAGILSGDVLLAGVDGQVQLGAELNNFIVASRQTEDGLRIVFAGAVPVNGPGELLRVYSGVGPNKAQLSRARFNDGAIVAEATQTVVGAVQPAGFALHANWPNPFNPETTIAFDLPQAGAVELQIFDVLGQSVRTLVAKSLPAGSHQVVWNGLDEVGAKVSSGVYVYRLQAGQQVQLRRMLLLK